MSDTSQQQQPVPIPTPGQPAIPAQTQPVQQQPVQGVPVQGVNYPQQQPTQQPAGQPPAQQPAPGMPQQQPTAVPATQQQPVGQQPATQQGQPAGGDQLGAALGAMSGEQLAALEQQIAAARANRPASLVDSLAALQGQLTEAHRGKEGAVADRKDASTLADTFESAIADIKRSLRRTELIEAATVAEFTNPQVVADSLVNAQGDITALIAQAAASGAWAMRKPATSAPVGGAQQQSTAGMDPGVAALVEEIRKAHGK